ESNGTINNSGQFIGTYAFDFALSGLFINTGTVSVTFNQLFHQSGTMINHGVISAPLLWNNTTLAGSGQCTGNVTDQGILAPSGAAPNSAGVFTIKGSYNKLGGSMEIDLGGTFDGGGNKALTQYDWTSIGGNFAVANAATIKLQELAGFDSMNLAGGEVFR